VAGTAEAGSTGKSPAIIAAPAGNPKPGAGELGRVLGGRNFRFGAKAPGEIQANAMNLLLRIAPLFLLGAFSLSAAAQSCYVRSEASGAVPSPVVTEHCFEFHNLDKDDAMDWLCQDNGAVESSRREIRASCPAGYFGICTAPMTPETLANERAAGSQAANGTWPTTVDDDARIVTYHYQATNRAQARAECESAGGTWSR